MNQVMPEWRAFSSDPPAGAPTDRSQAGPAEVAAEPVARQRGAIAVVVLTVLGGVVLGAALVGLAALLLLSPASGDDISVGTPLGGIVPAGVSLDEVDLGVATAEIVVDVAGAVVRPGLQRLAPGARVGDAIEAAGGYAPSADLTAAGVALNLAHALEDGAKVLVPALGITPEAVGGGDGRIDLNRAGRMELESLPGVGPVTAGKIVDARERRRFASVRDLRTREIVGQAVFDDIKGLVSVSG